MELPTDVENGVQYTIGTPNVRGGTVLGALRDGGFVEARIDTANPSRVGYMQARSTVAVRTERQGARPRGRATGHVRAHRVRRRNSGVTATGKAWGNGALTAGAGPTVDMGCATCHNPHGNGNYRILNPIPNPTATAGTFAAAAAPGVVVTDAADPTNATRNYTVIQTKGGTGTLLASDGCGRATGTRGGLPSSNRSVERDDRDDKCRAELATAAN